MSLRALTTSALRCLSGGPRFGTLAVAPRRFFSGSPARFASGRLRGSLSVPQMMPFLPRGLFDDHFLLGDSFFGDFFNFPRFGDIVQSSPGPVGFCRVLEDGLELELEVPRFRKEDITVDVDEKRGRLVISGKREPPSGGSQKGTVHVAGTSVPSFSRVYTVDPRVYDLKKLSSDVAEGVLTIRIPYVETKVSIEPSQPAQAALKEGAKEAEDVPVAHEQPSATTTTTQTTQEGTTETPSAVPSAAVVEKQPASSLTGEKGDQQMVDVFRWPPKLEVTPKSDKEPLSYTMTMPPGVTDPEVSVHLVHPGYLQVDVNHTSKTQNDFGFNEQRLAFSRTLPLPEGTTRDQVSAKMQDGKLVITLKDTVKEGTTSSSSSSS